ncbi:hypothetical protein EJ03DRAFT_68552 [Teratosphaeria nubilosa]|uniref:Uncharacterized protein n=1 Tax=Teratosphaeria nubilosa TaxID=161662 RepID=A0A6G1KSK0_9PEZI|nr:hypothetical protein EJ03DRAFT_68552 [Teratosphaeria nubilosa]
MAPFGLAVTLQHHGQSKLVLRTQPLLVLTTLCTTQRWRRFLLLVDVGLPSVVIGLPSHPPQFLPRCPSTQRREVGLFCSVKAASITCILMDISRERPLYDSMREALRTRRPSVERWQVCLCFELTSGRAKHLPCATFSPGRLHEVLIRLPKLHIEKKRKSIARLRKRVCGASARPTRVSSNAIWA